MSDAFTDLRNVLRARHDYLKSKIKKSTDPDQIRLLQARKTEIWETWRDLLFYAPSPSLRTRHPASSAGVPPSSPET
jgi:hypothetical protein